MIVEVAEEVAKHVVESNNHDFSDDSNNNYKR